jgi:hypothetical protein
MISQYINRETDVTTCFHAVWLWHDTKFPIHQFFIPFRQTCSMDESIPSRGLPAIQRGQFFFTPGEVYRFFFISALLSNITRCSEGGTFVQLEPASFPPSIIIL